MSIRNLDETGEPIFGKGVAFLPTGSEEVALLVVLRLKLMKEEWFLDRTAGVGWIDLGAGEKRIFGASADPAFLEAEVKRTILETKGIASLVSYEQVLDHETRQATVTFVATDIYAEVLKKTVVFPWA